MGIKVHTNYEAFFSCTIEIQTSGTQDENSGSISKDQSSQRDSNTNSGSPKWPCSICKRGVTKSSGGFLCTFCKFWVHVRCCNIKVRYSSSWKCSTCINNQPISSPCRTPALSSPLRSHQKNAYPAQ